MVLQIIRITMVKVEVPHERKLARPHIYLMLRITQMVRQTASKISGPKDQDFGDMCWNGVLRIHGEIQRLGVSWGITTLKINRLGMKTMNWKWTKTGLCCTSGPD
jgi:hypothetical protein